MRAIGAYSVLSGAWGTLTGPLRPPSPRTSAWRAGSLASGGRKRWPSAVSPGPEDRSDCRGMTIEGPERAGSGHVCSPPKRVSPQDTATDVAGERVRLVRHRGISNPLQNPRAKRTTSRVPRYHRTRPAAGRDADGATKRRLPAGGSECLASCCSAPSQTISSRRDTRSRSPRGSAGPCRNLPYWPACVSCGRRHSWNRQEVVLEGVQRRQRREIAG